MSSHNIEITWKIVRRLGIEGSIAPTGLRERVKKVITAKHKISNMVTRVMLEPRKVTRRVHVYYHIWIRDITKPNHELTVKVFEMSISSLSRNDWEERFFKKLISGICICLNHKSLKLDQRSKAIDEEAKKIKKLKWSD